MTIWKMYITFLDWKHIFSKWRLYYYKVILPFSNFEERQYWLTKKIFEPVYEPNNKRFKQIEVFIIWMKTITLKIIKWLDIKQISFRNDDGKDALFNYKIYCGRPKITLRATVICSALPLHTTLVEVYWRYPCRY